MPYVQTNENGEPMIVDNWYASDIQEVAVDKFDTTLSNKQIEEVMHVIVNTHDANIGIDWEVIEYAIDEVLSGETK